MLKTSRLLSRAAIAGAAGLGLCVLAGPVLAQAGPQGPAAKAVGARQEGYKQLGAAFKTINDELKASRPDMAAIAQAATRMRDLSVAAPRWFPKGSGPEAGVKTRAKPEIWTDAAGFAAAQRSFQTETAKLQTIAASGDLAALRVQVRATGATCGGCHDKYRVPQK